MDTFCTRQAGATFLEVVTTAGVIAVLGAIAAPNLADLRHAGARTAAINDFLHSVYLARSEAIKRNSVVSICRSRTGTRCDNTLSNWNSGWIVFENIDRDVPADTDPNEPILLRHETIASGTLTSNRVSFSFRPSVQSDVNGTVIYCPTNRSAKDARAIIISHTGRPRSSNRDSSGKALKC